MTKRFRVGIIGAGQAGERHAVGFSSLPNAEVVGIADVDAGRAGKVAESCTQSGSADSRVTVYDDWRAMLDNGLDILVVALPHSMHVAPAEAAAQAGVHVMMEKPIATTLADGQQIVATCAEHGVKLATSFVHRYREESQYLYEWVRSGALGEPVIVRETMNSERNRQIPKWVMTQELGGGGVLMYGGVHAIDRLRWLVGSEVTQVTATCHHIGPIPEAGATQVEANQVEDGVAALLTFANGVSANLMVTAPPYPTEPSIWESEIIGTVGMGRLRNRLWAQMSNKEGQVHRDTQAVAERLGPHYNFMRQAAAFIDAVVNDQEPPASGKDGVAVLEIALAIYKSARIGATVSINSQKNRV